MILVDASVWIDYLNGAENAQTDWLNENLSRQWLGLTDITLERFGVVDRDVVLEKLDTIDRCTARIEDVHRERGKDLLPVDVDDITALNLQRAIQAATNLAIHVVATEGYGTPDSMADAFALLERRGMIESELAESLRGMVLFRNKSIYEYSSVDPNIVEGIVQNRLGDLRTLGARVVEAFKL